MELSEGEVEVEVLVSKIMDGNQTYRRGQILVVDEEWARARGTSVRIVGVYHAPQQVEIILPPKKEEPAHVQGKLQGEGRQEAKGKGETVKVSPKKPTPAPAKKKK